jgi:hypothetical protein
LFCHCYQLVCVCLFAGAVERLFIVGAVIGADRSIGFEQHGMWDMRWMQIEKENMSMSTFPSDCHALIVEPEPLHAMALDLLLEEFGCRSMGPVDSRSGVKLLLSRMRPSFALVEVDLREELQPIAACLIQHEVPFALMAVGAEARVPEQIEGLRDRPRLLRPLHPASLHATAAALYQEHLAIAMASTDRHIEQAQSRLMSQLALIEQLTAVSHDTTAADALAQRFCQQLSAMRTTRLLLARRLERFAGALALTPGPHSSTAKSTLDRAASVRASRWTS